MTELRIIDCEQNSPAWHAARCGRVTASRVADIVRKTKTGVSKMRQTYMGELIAERLSGVQEDGFTSGPMKWGKENEDAARAEYALLYGGELRKVGFIIHHSIDMAGSSPDCLVNDDGGLELKCPNTATHVATLLGAPFDPDYILQCQWNMACTGRAWWDLVSFDPRLPAEMQLHRVRIHRDPIRIAELESEVRKFIAEVDETISQLTAKFGTMEAA
jgi:predicted phage-related endonuclease